MGRGGIGSANIGYGRYRAIYLLSGWGSHRLRADRVATILTANIRLSCGGSTGTGKDCARLVSAEQFDTFLLERHEAWVANVPIDYRWFPGTHDFHLGYTLTSMQLAVGLAAEGYWVGRCGITWCWKSGPIRRRSILNGPKEIASPAGEKIALVDRLYSLLNADGSIIRNDVLTYPGEFVQ